MGKKEMTKAEMQERLKELEAQCDHMDCDRIKAVLLLAVSGFDEAVLCGFSSRHGCGEVVRILSVCARFVERGVSAREVLACDCPPDDAAAGRETAAEDTAGEDALGR